MPLLAEGGRGKESQFQRQEKKPWFFKPIFVPCVWPSLAYIWNGSSRLCLLPKYLHKSCLVPWECPFRLPTGTLQCFGFFRGTPLPERNQSLLSTALCCLWKKSHFMRVSGCHSQQQPYRRELIFRVTAETPSNKKSIIQQYLLSAGNMYCLLRLPHSFIWFYTVSASNC